MSKKVEEMLESFPAEALEAYRNGGEWEYQPDTIDCGVWFPYACDNRDCEYDWHEHWYVLGYRIENGTLYETAMEVDTDGNWEFNDECDVESPDYERWRADYGYEASDHAEKDYAKWVIQHLDDPLSQYGFSLKDTHKVKRKARLKFVDGKFLVTHQDGNPVTSILQLSKGVREYFLWDRGDLECVDALELGSNMDELFQGKCADGSVWERIDSDTCDVTVEVDEPLPEREYKRQFKKIVIAAAKRHLRDLNKRMKKRKR